MFYDFEVTIPAGTAKSSPLEARLKMTHGVIHRFNIDVPPGPRGELYLAVFQGGHQLYPQNRGGYFRADNTMISFDDYKEMFNAPYELTVKGWSPSADYDHTVHVQVGIIESKIALASLRVARGLEKFLNVVGIGV